MKSLITSALVVSGLVGTGLAGSVLVAAPSFPDRVPAEVDCATTDSCPPSWSGVLGELPPPVADREDESETEDDGEPASPEGQARREAAMTFVDAMRAWTSCVSEAAPAHDESTGDFDPVAACGEKPAPPGGPSDSQGKSESGNGNSGSPRPPASDLGGDAAEQAEEDGEGFGQGIADQARPDGPGRP